MSLKYGLTVFEGVSKNSALLVRAKDLLYSGRTKYQEVQILNTEDFGRVLVLDGYVQSTEADEYMYHEVLVQPAMITHPDPKEVLIIGGGEGATLREVLKHPSVKKAVMVDIDGELLELSKKYLEFMHRGSFYDPRAEVVVMDGYKYIANERSRKYDVIVLDLTDPYSSEIAKKLYSKEFYSRLKGVLKDNGIIVTQAGNSFFYPETYSYVLKNIKSNFKIVKEYWYWIPSFSYACNFIIASDRFDPEKLDEHEVNKIIKRRQLKLKIYSGALHVSLFKSKIIIGG